MRREARASKRCGSSISTPPAPERLADQLGDPVVVGSGEGGFAEAIRGADAVVNAAGHAFNLRVMQACLEVGAHYTDLGGLFHVALEQYSLDEPFRTRGWQRRSRWDRRPV